MDTTSIQNENMPPLDLYHTHWDLHHTILLLWPTEIHNMDLQFHLIMEYGVLEMDFLLHHHTWFSTT